MEAKVMTPVKGNVNEITEFAFEAAESIEKGMGFKLPSADEALVVIVQNTDAAEQTVTLKAPASGSYAASTSDEVLALKAGGFAVIRIESARFANNDGTVILVPSALTVKAAVLY